eukprot:2594018-Prymnesium_polylepis.1
MTSWRQVGLERLESSSSLQRTPCALGQAAGAIVETGKPHVRQHARDRRRRFRCAAAERQQAESQSTATAAPPSVQCSLEQMQV